MTSEQTLIGAIDQGTSSTRFLIYQLHPRKIIASHQIAIQQHFPHAGWVEIDPEEIISTITECTDVICEALKKNGFSVANIKAVGISNQRETTILWDRETGKALYNAIVWLDSRTTELADMFVRKTCCQSKEHFRDITGLPIHPYFSALKIRWLLDNVDKVKDALKRGTLMFGTVDTWIIYKLTGRHVTDVTNASRTLLMSLRTLNWDEDLCNFFEIPLSILPKIYSSAEIYATISVGSLKGVPLSGCLGDQQAAMFGEHCLAPGDTKCTFGTGTFMLTNTGNAPIISGNGLLTTVAYRDLSEVEPAAASVTGTDGVVFVPCFTGLYTPYWDFTARGILCGLAQTTERAHIIRAALEAVGGGMTVNLLFMQLLSDILGMDVIKSSHTEASCWGVAMTAAIGAKIIGFKEVESYREKDIAVLKPKLSARERQLATDGWKEAVKRARGWIYVDQTN